MGKPKSRTTKSTMKNKCKAAAFKRWNNVTVMKNCVVQMQGMGCKLGDP